MGSVGSGEPGCDTFLSEPLERFLQTHKQTHHYWRTPGDATLMFGRLEGRWGAYYVTLNAGVYVTPMSERPVNV